MNAFARIFGGRDRDEDLEEWARHHDDPRSSEGFALYQKAVLAPDLSNEELHEMWRRANALVGQRAPSDYGEFLAYGYLAGRVDSSMWAKVREATR